MRYKLHDMKTTSLLKDLRYDDNKPVITALLDTDTSKEVRVVMKAGQEMKEHKTKFPITVEMFEGTLDFGVLGDVLHLVKGDILSLDANIPHDLLATSDSIVRLTLSKLDTVNRVKDVAAN